MTIFTSGVCQRTKWAWCSPLRCGQHCSTMVTWAASGIYSLTDRVRMSGAWPRSRGLQGSSPPALRSLPSSAWATPAKTMGSVERVGTAMCVTALELDTWAAPVKEVGLCFYLIFLTQLLGNTSFLSGGHNLGFSLWNVDATQWHTSTSLCIVLRDRHGIIEMWIQLTSKETTKKRMVLIISTICGGIDNHKINKRGRQNESEHAEC